MKQDRTEFRKHGETKMKTFLAATAAVGLALTAAPGIAQDMEMTTQQQTMYDGWSAEQQSTYDAWPMNAKTYYWTLDAGQQEIWWNNLNNEQRVRIVGMTPAQQTQTWASINSQLNGNSAMANNSGHMSNNSGMSGNTTATSRSTTSGNVRFVSNEVVQNAPAPHNGEYPVCSSSRQDNCMNPWEAGRRGPGVPRPLQNWPGQPASSM
ncbi:hypothetical protein [Aurantiacibacter spongiae]|uniref:hypothetical protein n=1 Tax=Aurantiacibacter spongiae TaxID=2488860 RepID=UPI0015F2C0CA|nr:hypothetical protein [Aurantiacibacter spongiae]